MSEIQEITLGGFLSLGALIVVTPDSEKHPRFRPINLAQASDDVAGAKAVGRCCDG